MNFLCVIDSGGTTAHSMRDEGLCPQVYMETSWKII